MIEGDFFDESFDQEPNGSYADGVADLECPWKKNRERSEEVREKIFTCKCENGTTDSGPGKNVFCVDVEGFKNEKSCNDPDQEIDKESEDRKKPSDEFLVECFGSVYGLEKNRDDTGNSSRHEKYEENMINHLKISERFRIYVNIAYAVVIEDDYQKQAHDPYENSEKMFDECRKMHKERIFLLESVAHFFLLCKYSEQ